MKRKNKILAVVAISLLIGALVALPCFAYDVTDTASVLGYVTFPMTFNAYSSNGYGATDVTWTTIYTDDNVSSAVISDDLSYINDGYLRWYFYDDALDDYSVDFLPMSYTKGGVGDVLKIGDFVSYRLKYTCFDRVGNVISRGDREVIGAANGGDGAPISNVTSILDTFLTDDGVFCHFEIYSLVCTSQTYVDQSIVPGNTNIADVAYVPLSVSDTLVNATVADIPIGDFLWNSVRGFLSFEIAPSVQLYHILLAVISLPLIVWFLKVVAGG